MKRNELGVSLEKISQNICSPSTLHRIETGKQKPSMNTLKKLSDRLGISLDSFQRFADETELEIALLRRSVNDHYDNGQYDEVVKLLNKMEKIPATDLATQNYIEYVRILLLRDKKGDPLAALDKIKKYVDFVLKGFKLKNILRYNLAKDELSLLRNLATTYYCAGDINQAIDIQYALIDYIEKRVRDPIIFATTYVTVLYILSLDLSETGDYNEALRLCEKGLENTVKYSRSYSWGNLLYNKGCILLKLNRKEDAIKSLQEAYYIYRAEKKSALCEDVIKDALENDISMEYFN
jgi:tetratricopeptide (TPR) repeat protein